MIGRVICLKQAISLVLSLVFAGLSALSTLAVGTGYDDVPATSWYAGAVRYVAEKGLMSGTGDGKFSPDAPMTRAMLTAVLYRNEGQPPVVDIGAFSDVQGSWYASAANWAAASGVVSGYGDGRFGGDDSVTRQDMATILWRYAGSPAAAVLQNYFALNTGDLPAPEDIDFGSEDIRGFRFDNVLHDKAGGDIHFGMYIPESYGGSKPYALFVTLPGYGGLHFQGVGVNIRSEDFGVEAQKYNEEMIILAPSSTTGT